MLFTIHIHKFDSLINFFRQKANRRDKPVKIRTVPAIIANAESISMQVN